jgi:hypothetical protein
MGLKAIVVLRLDGGRRDRPGVGVEGHAARLRPRLPRLGHRPAERRVGVDGHLALFHGEAVQQLVGVERLARS